MYVFIFSLLFIVIFLNALFNEQNICKDFTFTENYTRKIIAKSKKSENKITKHY